MILYSSFPFSKEILTEKVRAVFPLHNTCSCFHSTVFLILQLERMWIICENICCEIQKVKYCLLLCSILKTLLIVSNLHLIYQILVWNPTLFDNLAMYALKHTHTQIHTDKYTSIPPSNYEVQNHVKKPNR